MCSICASALAVGDVLGNAQQILRLAFVVGDGDLLGSQQAQAVVRGVDRLLLDDL
jgi:hypothetical protein